MDRLFSDNMSPMAEPMLRAIVEANEGFEPSYAADNRTSELQEVVSDLFGVPAFVFLTASGTAANALSMAGFCPPWKRVLCHARSHVMEAEAGAPEAFSGGGKLTAPVGRPDRLDVDEAEALFGRAVKGDPHTPAFGLVSLAQLTESGTAYELGEVSAIAALARRHGARVHMDGARFANALVSLQCSPADISVAAGVDVLSLGIAKNGGSFCDLVISFDSERAEEFRFRQMRSGHLLAKHRFAAAQALAYFRDGLWLELAAAANSRASEIATLLADRGVQTALPVRGNILFPLVNAEVVENIRAHGHRIKTQSPSLLGNHEAQDEGRVAVRLVTSWCTSSDDVKACLALLG